MSSGQTRSPVLKSDAYLVNRFLGEPFVDDIEAFSKQAFDLAPVRVGERCEEVGLLEKIEGKMDTHVLGRLQSAMAFEKRRTTGQHEWSRKPDS